METITAPAKTDLALLKSYSQLALSVLCLVHGRPELWFSDEYEKKEPISVERIAREWNHGLPALYRRPLISEEEVEIILKETTGMYGLRQIIGPDDKLIGVIPERWIIEKGWPRSRC